MAIRISTLGVRGWVKYYLDDCYGEVVIVDVWYKVSDICFAVVGTHFGSCQRYRTSSSYERKGHYILRK